MIQIHAVFENGVFRPLTNVHFEEGQVVRFQVVREVIREQPQSEYAKRLAAAKTIQEKIEIMNAAPSDLPEGYDLIEALDRNRVLSGSLSWFPTEPESAPHE